MYRVNLSLLALLFCCDSHFFAQALFQNHCWPSFHFSKNHWPFHRWQWWAAKPFIQWQWSSRTKTIEKPSTTMVLWQKPLTIPWCSKFYYCCGLISTLKIWIKSKTFFCYLCGFGSTYKENLVGHLRKIQVKKFLLWILEK